MNTEKQLIYIYPIQVCNTYFLLLTNRDIENIAYVKVTDLPIMRSTQVQN